MSALVLQASLYYNYCTVREIGSLLPIENQEIIAVTRLTEPNLEALRFALRQRLVPTVAQSRVEEIMSDEGGLDAEETRLSLPVAAGVLVAMRNVYKALFAQLPSLGIGTDRDVDLDLNLPSEDSEAALDLNELSRQQLLALSLLHRTQLGAVGSSPPLGNLLARANDLYFSSPIDACAEPVSFELNAGQCNKLADGLRLLRLGIEGSLPSCEDSFTGDEWLPLKVDPRLISLERRASDLPRNDSLRDYLDIGDTSEEEIVGFLWRVAGLRGRVWGPVNSFVDGLSAVLVQYDRFTNDFDQLLEFLKEPLSRLDIYQIQVGLDAIET